MMGFDTERILSDVPRMRRYAALMCSNDKERGDRFVELALKDLVASPDELIGKDEYRPILFRHLQRRLARELGASAAGDRMKDEASAVAANGDDRSNAITANMLALLAEMPIEQRSVLLLVVIEGLIYDQVGYVLGTSSAIVRALLADARNHLDMENTETSKTA